MLEKEEFLTNQNMDKGNKINPLENINPHNTVSLYLKEIEQIPLLEHKQELQLARQIQNGEKAKKDLDNSEVQLTDDEILELKLRKAIGDQAVNILVRHNLRLVVAEAKKRRGEGIPFLDLIQEGNIGLQKAARKFDPEKGYMFSTYATCWIKGEIGRGIDRQSRKIRIPVHARDEIQRMYRVISRLEQKSGQKPSNEELAKELGWNEERVKDRKKQSQGVISLDRPLGEAADAELFGDVLEDQYATDPQKLMETRSEIREILTLVNRLKENYRKVIEYRYGIFDGEYRTQKEVGDILGLSKQRISQIEKAAKERIVFWIKKLAREARKKRNLKYECRK